MSHYRYRLVLLLILTGWLTAGQVRADAPAVRDKAHVFTPAVIRQANEDLAEIKSQYRKDLVIETFPAVPGAGFPWFRAKKVQDMSPEARERYYDEWARDRVQKLHVTGIYVLICKEPAPLHVHVVVGQQTAATAFRGVAADQLKGQLLAHFEQGKYDQGLTETITFVRSTLQANLGKGFGPLPPFPWAVILWAIVAVLLLWIILETGLASYAARTGDHAVHQGAGAYGGGGSYPAGLFATMTANWRQEFLDAGASPQPAPAIDPTATTLTFERPGLASKLGAAHWHDEDAHQGYVHGQP